MSIISETLSRLFGAKYEKRVLLNGLDASGKTTFLYKLKLGEVVTTIPTIGFNVETIDYKKFHFTLWDVGGCDKIRPLWRHYYQNTQAIFYFVSSTDLERMTPQAQCWNNGCDVKEVFKQNTSNFSTTEEMVTLLREDELRDAVVAVICTKQDLPGALSPQEIRKRMRLDEIMGKDRAWNIFGVSCTKGEGLYEVLDWAATALGTRPKPTESSKSTTTTTTTDTTSTKQDENKEESKDSDVVDKSKTKENKKAKLEEWLERKDEDDELFLVKFENVTYDGPFDHYTHLRIAYLYFMKLGRRKGLEKIFNHLKIFLEKSGRTRNTFSITITYFWAHMVWYALESTKVGKDNFKTFLVMNPLLSDFNLYKVYYSDELFLRNEQSRKEFMFPDVKERGSNNFKQLPSTVDMNLDELKEAKKGIDVIAQLKELVKEDTDDKTFIKLFETKQLTKWTHLYLLRAIWYYLETLERKEGKKKIFEEFKRHDGEYYHETLTYFWLQMVDFYRVVAKEWNPNKLTSFNEWIDILRDNSFKISSKRSWFSRTKSYDLENSTLWKEFYTESVLFEKKGDTDPAKQMVLPDLQPLPSIQH